MDSDRKRWKEYMLTKNIASLPPRIYDTLTAHLTPSHNGQQHYSLLMLRQESFGADYRDRFPRRHFAAAPDGGALTLISREDGECIYFPSRKLFPDLVLDTARTVRTGPSPVALALNGMHKEMEWRRSGQKRESLSARLQAILSEHDELLNVVFNDPVLLFHGGGSVPPYVFPAVPDDPVALLAVPPPLHHLPPLPPWVPSLVVHALPVAHTSLVPALAPPSAVSPPPSPLVLPVPSTSSMTPAPVPPLPSPTKKERIPPPPSVPAQGQGLVLPLPSLPFLHPAPPPADPLPHNSFQPSSTSASAVGQIPRMITSHLQKASSRYFPYPRPPPAAGRAHSASPIPATADAAASGLYEPARIHAWCLKVDEEGSPTPPSLPSPPSLDYPAEQDSFSAQITSATTPRERIDLYFSVLFPPPASILEDDSDSSEDLDSEDLSSAQVNGD
ncbi:hypothetical protein JCM11251_000396 [Rhodosporidiobolus azoricus]